MLRLACQAMRQLHPEAIAAIQSKALFSKAEEQLLSKVGSVRLRTGTEYKLDHHQCGELCLPCLWSAHVQMTTSAGTFVMGLGRNHSWPPLWLTVASSSSLGGLGDKDGVGMRKPWHEKRICCLQTSQPTLETFQDLLHRHPDAFYLARTAKALQAHWQLMKQYYLLEDQTGNTQELQYEQPGTQVGELV